MSEINFPFSGKSEIEFDMEISGTSNKPTFVQFSIINNSEVLSIPAVNTLENTWKIEIVDLGHKLSSGQFNFTINVLIKERLITAFRGNLTVTADEQQIAKLEPIKTIEPSITHEEINTIIDSTEIKETIIPKEISSNELKSIVDSIIETESKELKRVFSEELAPKKTTPFTLHASIKPVRKFDILKTLEEKKPLQKEPKQSIEPVITIKRSKIIYK